MSRPAQSKIIRGPLCSLNVPFKPFLLSRFRREDFWGMSLSLLKRKEKVGKKAFSLSVILNNYVLTIGTIESTNEMISEFVCKFKHNFNIRAWEINEIKNFGKYFAKMFFGI